MQVGYESIWKISYEKVEAFRYLGVAWYPGLKLAMASGGFYDKLTAQNVNVTLIHSTDAFIPSDVMKRQTLNEVN